MLLLVNNLAQNTCVFLVPRMGYRLLDSEKASDIYPMGWNIAVRSLNMCLPCLVKRKLLNTDENIYSIWGNTYLEYLGRIIQVKQRWTPKFGQG